MKVLYSQLKKYLPNLTSDAYEVAQAFTSTGQMIDKLFEVEFQGKKDYLLDLEVRQNRADCFGVLGLARELAAFYNIELAYPESFTNTDHLKNNLDYELPIGIRAVGAVKRVMALKFKNIQIKESPAWLKEYLGHYEINIINNLVDLTNYVMIETGIPSHVFDAGLVGDKLVWEINPEYKKITTLNGEELDLTEASDVLLISDDKRVLSLSFIGGKVDEVNNSSTDIILEMGIYDGGLVRRNSRNLRTITEASQRLEKFLDPDMIPQAFNMLVNLILEHCGGEIASNVFDQHVQKTPDIEIRLRLEKVSQLAGVDIPKKTIEDILYRLGFVIKSEGDNALILKRPVNRLDVEIEEDVIEEIIRMYGYDNIPKDHLSIEITKDITPAHLRLIDKIQDILTSNGYDEVRSWVLVEEESNARSNFEDWEAIKVTNSINEEVPFLRQSIAVSLLGQLQNYRKNNIPDIQLFEVGKVFGKRNGIYDEHYTLGVLRGDNDINTLKQDLENILRTFEVDGIRYVEAKNMPQSAHPKSVYDIEILNSEDEFEKIGILYVTNRNIAGECVIAEVDINRFNDISLGLDNRSVYEITKKIVDLDINLVLGSNSDINIEVANRLKDIKNIWKWEVVDRYEDNGKTKYTVRVYYMGLSDQEAKELHARIFGV